MKSKKQKTFAELARDIQNKYKKLVEAGDQIAIRSMNKELARLKEQQELTRQNIQSIDQSDVPQMQYGGDLPEFEIKSDRVRRLLDALYISDPNYASGKSIRPISLTQNIPQYSESNIIGEKNLFKQPKFIPFDTIYKPDIIRTNSTNEKGYLYSDPYPTTTRTLTEALGIKPGTKTPVVKQTEKVKQEKGNKDKGNFLGLNDKQLVGIGSQLATTLGQLGPILAANKVKYPDFKPVATPEFQPTSIREPLADIDRRMSYIMNDPYTDSITKTAMMSKAFIEGQNAKAQLEEKNRNENIRAKQDWLQTIAQIGAENAKGQYEADKLKATEKSSGLMNVADWLGRVGSTVATGFSDADKAEKELMGLNLASREGRFVGTDKKGYFTFDTAGNPSSGLYIKTRIGTSGEVIKEYYDGNKKILRTEFEKLFQERNKETGIKSVRENKKPGE